MASPDGVLAAIDAAVRDYSVSPDAMRWEPDEPAPAAAVPMSAAREAVWYYATTSPQGELHQWIPLGHAVTDVAFVHVENLPEGELLWAERLTEPGELSIVLMSDVSGFTASMAALQDMLDGAEEGYALAALGHLVAQSERLHALKTKYNQRRRGRNRR